MAKSATPPPPEVTSPCTREKSPLQSKKFIAYLLAEATWKVVVIIGLSGIIYIQTQPDTTAVDTWMYWLLLACVVIAGFVEAGFIGGQAWLDRYVRLALIAANTGDESPSHKE
jgi:hypothetical protein